MKPGSPSYLLSPSRIIEERDPRGIPMEYPRWSNEIPADEFGDIVHAILQGIPEERVLREYGREDLRESVLGAVNSIRRELERSDLKDIFHEVEIVSLITDDEGEKVPVIGRMDLLGRSKDDEYSIVDYKTGIRKEVHKEQLDIYRELSRSLIQGEISTKVIYSRGHEE
jgi:ATP-dependent exoDNAse (exonuclease V) beta subunit